MNLNKTNSDLIDFWNKEFKLLKPEKLVKSSQNQLNSFETLLHEMGNTCKNIVDVGCGSGFALFKASLYGDMFQEGLGIDPSLHAIENCIETAKISQINNLSFVHGNHHYLDGLSKDSYDGVLCSNVLDVVPYETSNDIISSIDRILKPKGLLLLKINFFLTKDLIKRVKMEELDKNSFFLNGVLRGVNLTNEEWISRFNGYDLIRTDTYQRLENGPKDRLILLKKR